ncbi:unnamed protein product, partial [Mesorhabditis belari]|uniref:Protein kinase domain-containing protein n=1 Tax=Mesorhabditis belari TaxID=2138241 RepID=A0AAF3EKF1_9BILA
MFRTDNQENFPWKEVFKRCHSVDLLNLEKVCKRFHQLISLNNLFWKDLCARDGIEIPPDHITDSPNEQKQTFNYRYLYHFASKGHVNPYGPNIIADLPINAKQAEECTLEEPPIGYDLKKGPAKCLATSNSWGWRLIMVNLEKCGIEPWILDDVRPTIIVTEKHAPRSDCGAIYMFGAEVGQPWTLETLKVNYPPGMRNLCLYSYAKDTQALNSLDHPNLIKFMKCVESSTDPQERFAVVTEYYERGTLSNFILNPKNLYTIKTVISWTRGLFDALANSYEKLGYLHGDINPGNIFITKDWSIKKALFLMVLKKNQDLMQIKWNW